MAGSRRGVQALYRKLQRLCRDVERQPDELSLLLGRPPRWYDPRHGGIVRAPLGKRPFVDNCIHDLSGGCTEFAHFSGGSSASKAVRRHREFSDAMGSNYAEEALALLARLRIAREVRADVASLVGTLSAPQSHLNIIPEVSRVPLPNDGSSRSANVGDWLVAHPVACISQPIFDRAIILVDAVDESPAGVRGVVINKPLNATLRQLTMRWPQAEDRAWADTLGPLLDLELGGGGPVVLESLQESMTWIHCHGLEVPGATEIAPALWVGGCLSTLSAKVAAMTSKEADLTPNGDGDGSSKCPVNRAAAAGVWPFLGYSGWASLQLFNELERGVWLRVRASSSCLGKFCFGSSSADPIVAWQTIMSSVGLRHLADLPRNDKADYRLLQYLQAHHDLTVSSEEEDVDVSYPAEKEIGKSKMIPQDSQRKSLRRAKSSARRRR